MRTLHTDKIIEAVKEMCISANLYLADDKDGKIRQAAKEEDSTLGKQILNQLIENMEIAGEDKTPICQDTGMAVLFVEYGERVVIDGNFKEAVEEGVRRAYIGGYLRKSVVTDPVFDRVNTKDNTPAIIYTDIVEGDKIKILAGCKGFGSENMSQIKMLTPSAGIEGVKQFILDAVKYAGPNPCPPIVVGIGIGGTFDKAAQLAKKATLRPINTKNEDPRYAKLEDELIEEINKMGFGPAGLGGNTTAIGVNVETYPTHIAGMPVAVNICCHAARHKEAVI